MIVDSLVAAFRSIENPSVPLRDAGKEFWEALGAGRASSGIHVSRETALTFSAMWRGVNVVSRDVAKMPLHVYRRLEADDRERAVDHPAYRLLRRKPNDEMTPAVFKQTLMGHALLDGNGYAYIFRNGAGEPEELVPMLPNQTSLARVNGRLWYLTMVRDEPRTLRSEDVLHIRGFSHNGLAGYNVIQKARESIGWGLAMRKFSAKFFSNGARSAGVLMTPGHMGEEEAKNLLTSFNEKQAGLDNAHKTILLEEGAKYTPNTIHPDEAQFLESMQFSLLDVANWLLLAPHKVGHPGRTAYASLQEENQRHLDEAIDPWAVVFEEECQDKLLTEQQKRDDSHYVEFNRDALIRVDFKTKVEARAKQVQSGELSPDEARRLSNRGPRPDGQGHRYWMPTNMRYADELPTAKPAAPAAGADAGGDAQGKRTSPNQIVAEARIVEDVAQRIAARVTNEAARAAKKPAGFLAWLDDDLDRLDPTIARIAYKPIGAVGLMRGCDRPGWRALVNAILGSSRRRFLETSGQCSADMLPAAIAGQEAALREQVVEIINAVVCSKES